MGTAVFDRVKLAKLLEDLAMLSGMGVTFWHPEQDFCLIETSNIPSPYCGRLRKSPAMVEKCTQCEREALKAAKADLKPHYFTCHAGLHECISPVVYNGEILGFVMIGQIRFLASRIENIECVRGWIEQNGFDFNEIRQLYLNLPQVSRYKQQALLHMIEALSSFVHIEGLVRRIEFPLITRIEEFIDHHLAEHITLDDVALALNVSKSTICHTIQTEKGTTLTKIINKKRIDKVRAAIEAGASVTSAAYAAGFSSASYCSRVYLQITGARPTHHRQNA